MAQCVEKERVCVTGAGGYVASWVVKFLLSNGYMVHGTVRDPCDEKKNGHLKKLKNATENLQLFKTDLLDYEGLCAAIAGCTGVLHVACPVPAVRDVPNPEAELLEPAITGTRNVLNACLNAKVKKVVVVSSVGAVMVNPNWPKDQAMDENCWTDGEHCKTLKLWYCLGKTLAESEALEYARRNELNLVTVCPSICIGPMLQSTVNASSLFLLHYLKDGKESVEDEDRIVVDVRDVADAILLAYEKPEAEGRYICSSHTVRSRALVEMLKGMYPNYNYPKSFTEVKQDAKISSEKLQNLGWKFRPLEETIVDAVKNYEESGLLGNE
ncbi:cinnamoyl-CoA reductase 1-like [Cornus florida]|uniref:cinnamoyl-CoA reductase 1-like n=1 Tax=Cornus florida TaxID=4283 RepID=UPI00289A3E94|nr:cinnamoyl-CoA reductase 1-like [Cornus florida]